ncbi:hypothetical protein MTO96_022742 [Rhipicephalus appendiculatus]
MVRMRDPSPAACASYGFAPTETVSQDSAFSIIEDALLRNPYSKSEGSVTFRSASVSSLRGRVGQWLSNRVFSPYAQRLKLLQA